jgi:hypothetical protein
MPPCLAPEGAAQIADGLGLRADRTADLIWIN